MRGGSIVRRANWNEKAESCDNGRAWVSGIDFGEEFSEATAKISASLPLGRIGLPAELAHAVIFLMTNTYSTGTVLRVDGGS